MRLLPYNTLGMVRPVIYRLVAGLDIGPRTQIAGRMTVFGRGDLSRKLIIGRRCYFSTPLWLDLNGTITIGDNVTVGHDVTIITSDHELGCSIHRCGALHPASVSIGEGVWIAARVTLLPGSSIGRGAVIAAGSVVRGEIPPNVLAAGVPARVLRRLDQAS